MWGALCGRDVIPIYVQEGCGFHPRGESTQVYSLSPHHGNLSLSGTAEVPLAGKVVPSRDPTSHDVYCFCHLVLLL